MSLRTFRSNFMRVAYRWILKVAMVAAMGLILRNAVWGPSSDSNHPDFAKLSEQFERVRLERVARPPVDLASVNGGAWGTACLFGGYTSPINAMRDLGANISIGDIIRFDMPLYGMFSVKEYALMVTFIDKNNRAHFIYFREAIGAETQHFSVCVTKPETMVAV